MKEKLHKNIKNEIDKINNFLLTETFLVEHTKNFPLDNSEITLSKHENNCFIDFDLNLKTNVNPNEVTFRKLGFNEDFKVISDKEEFIIPARSAHRLIGKRFVSTENLKGKFDTIHSKDFPLYSKSIFRTVRKIQNEHSTTIFLGSEYSCEDTSYSLGLVVIVVENLIFHVYRHCQEHYDLLIIECLNQTNFETFKKICELILKSIGFLTGNWHQNEHFIFSYLSSTFENIDSIFYESLGNSIISNKEIINPREFRTFMETNSEERSLLTQLLFPEKTLSNLVVDLKTKPEIERTVELLIEGNGINSPLIKCSIFHVALETIVGLINSENKKFFQPIKNSESLELLKEELQKIILSNKEKFSQLEFDSLVKKITYINTPFNKDKFLIAYDFYKIELPESLKNLLNNRNKFLHGKTPYEEGLLKTKIKDLNLEADRIHMLVSILLLKRSNYKGHLKNQAAYRLATERYYENPELEINESLFYKI